MSPWSAGSDLEEAIAPPLVLPVEDLSRAGEARRAAVALAGTLGFDEGSSGRIALAVTEAATNVARHGGGGQLVVRPVDDGSGLELLALDRGPGMADLDRCLRDGFSTGGSAGSGLGAIARAADLFDVWSRPGAGTVLLARFVRPSAPGAPVVGAPALGVVCTAAPGETVRGDAWAVDVVPGVTRLCVVDGLGHGPDAHEAARRAIVAFRASRGGAGETLQQMHLALRATRGAAAAVAYLDPAASCVRFAGVGNVSALVVDPDGERTHALTSHNGIVGHEAVRIQEFTTPWTPASVVVFHTDGIQGRWRLAAYPGILDHHPSILAAALHRDFLRGRDDATVLALRERVRGAA